MKSRPRRAASKSNCCLKVTAVLVDYAVILHSMAAEFFPPYSVPNPLPSATPSQIAAKASAHAGALCRAAPNTSRQPQQAKNRHGIAYRSLSVDQRPRVVARYLF